MNTQQEYREELLTTPEPDLISLIDDAHFWDQGPPPYEEPKQPVVIPLKKKTKKMTVVKPPSDWQAIIQEYDALMINKGKMESRRFNHLAHLLLGQCVALARSMESATTKPTESQYRDEDIEAFSEFRDILLNAREMATDELSSKLCSFIEKGLSPGLTAEERKEELQKKSLAFLAEISPQLSLKAGPVIKSHIARQFGSDLDDLLAEVRLPEMSIKDKTRVYQRMFENLINDPRCVSFACTNRQLLGQLKPVDVWFLTFFAFVTVKRSRGDNLLMLGCVGTFLPLNFSIYQTNRGLVRLNINLFIIHKWGLNRDPKKSILQNMGAQLKFIF